MQNLRPHPDPLNHYLHSTMPQEGVLVKPSTLTLRSQQEKKQAETTGKEQLVGWEEPEEYGGCLEAKKSWCFKKKGKSGQISQTQLRSR